MAETSARSAYAVSPERITSHLKSFASIGYSASGGMRRLAFSKNDLRARQVLVHIMGNLGLDARIDPFGTVYGRLPDPDGRKLPAVMVGSHLDAVPGGGRFDGSIGVVAGLEAAAVVSQYLEITERTLEVVSFSCEESSRFGRGTIGSGLMTGVWSAKDILHLRDGQGQTLERVLRRLGLDPERLDEVRRPPSDVAAFLEIHIEQGRVLEEAPAAVGIVGTIAAPTRFRLTLSGQADHSGATPMNLRRDALAGAAEIILAVERCAKAVSGVVATVGTAKVEPGAINVVPGNVEMSIDIRSTVGSARRDVVDQIRNEIDRVCTARDLSSNLELLTDEDPVTLHPQIIDTLERAARQRGTSYLHMPSGAGHDAMHLATICPTGMLLVPSRGGISHHADEWTDFDDIVEGIQVIVDATVDLMLNGVPG